MRRIFSVVLLTALVTVVRAAAAASPANPSFEEGTAAGVPSAWMPSGAACTWERGGAHDGERAAVVRGSGDDITYWRSGALAFAPGGLYRLSFWARSLDAAGGGTAVTGPVFCNRDIGCPPMAWTRYSAVFAALSELTPEQSWLRFGQWHVAGRIAFDAIAVEPVQAVHLPVADMVLGEGEGVDGNTYEFVAPLGGAGLNASRPLSAARCHFNSNRWVFGADSEVIYEHRLGGRRQLAASGTITVGHHVGGELRVEISRDGRDWTPAGSLDAAGSLAFEVPAALLPAEAVMVRLRAVAKARVGAADSDPGSFQVHAYRYQAELDGPPAHGLGQTRYLLTRGPAEGFQVEVVTLGSARPGGVNAVTLRVRNTTGNAVTLAPTTTLTAAGREPVTTTTPALSLPPGETLVTCPYTLTQSGDAELAVQLPAPLAWSAEAALAVPVFYDCGYGAMLPGSSTDVALWSASSGWKVPRQRALPTAQAAALALSAAGNEAEAIQLVLRPTRPLAGLTVTPGALRGPAGAVLPAAAVTVLRVGYVPVTQKTDATGVVDDWPDPLPPLAGPIDLEADANQPLWVRVKVPAGTPAGVYHGVVALAASGGYHAEVPLQLEVHGFDLPRRLTCETAFGFDPGAVWRYHGLTDPAQRRQVLERYWQSFSDHHISPYNPAPLDPFVVTWPKAGPWLGGRRDDEVRASGQSSLHLSDTSTTSTVSARYGDAIALSPRGLRLRCRYRTEAPGHTFVITLNHHRDGQWLSGRNLDLVITGDGSWQSFERVITAFPEGADSLRLTLWATRWSTAGEATGGVWFDDVSLVDLADDRERLRGGDFEPVAAAEWRPTFDWTAWDAAMQRAIDEFGFSTFRLPVQGLGSGTFHARNEPNLLGFGEDTPEYQAAMPAYLGALESHLREKGWLDEAFVYWFDEPDTKDYAFVMNGFRKLREWAPGLRRMLTEQVEEGLIGGPNLWCPLTPQVHPEVVAARRAAGERFWWYVCTGPKAPYATLFIDHPGTELRVWLWQTWSHGVEGILVWQTNYWTSGAAYPEPDRPQNPYRDPMGWVSGYSTPAGSRRPWGNGDGRFIYPPEAAADGRPAAPVLEGPVDSVRWEMLRDGLEDYEYFAILRRLLEERGERLEPETRRRAQALLEVPREVSESMTRFTLDPAPLEAHRRLLGQAITDLQRR
ncbi:MAG: DUF4091 domain-containing protein [Lentisphaerae bacterium]|nr:DUF4091 domain-containing protein [Lentisphaerota bacterium]